MPEGWTFQDSQALVVVKAGLLSKGWMEEIDGGGIRITESGCAKAHEMWMSFKEEDRVLLGAFTKKILANV